jgi:SPP1 gp7 family putative phage head morphogenesis protein
MKGNVSAEDWAFAQQRLPAYRAEMIARTEAVRAANAGSDALFSAWGVGYKQWLAQLDNRVRHSHAAMDGQIVPMNADFVSGDGNRLRYPGDPYAPAGETVNCRCSELPIVELTPDDQLQLQMQASLYV